jgi:hypothetical protein
VGLSGRSFLNGGGPGHVRQARVSGLADLHRAVVDELGGDETGAGGDDEEGGGSRRGDPPAGCGGRADQQRAAPPHPALPSGEGVKEEGQQRPHSGPDPSGYSACPFASAVPGEEQRGVGTLQPSIAGPIDLPGPAARRCYHRRSLRQFSLFFRRTLRRAPWGLFLRLITTTELRNHGTQLSTGENPEHRDHGAHRRR